MSRVFFDYDIQQLVCIWTTLTEVMDVRKVIEECRIEIQAASEVGKKPPDGNSPKWWWLSGQK